MRALPVQRPTLPQQRIACMDASTILCDLAPAEREALSHRLPMRRLAAGTVIYAPSDPLEVVFIVLTGQVHLYHLAPDGFLLTREIFGAGAMFGEMALLGQSLHEHYAETRTDCEICVMTVTEVRSLLLQDTRICQRLLEFVGKRQLEAERQIAMLTHRHVPTRVALTLWQLFEHGAKGEIACTHETLATMVGANRETVTKILNTWRAEGIVDLARSRIVLIDARALHQLTLTIPSASWTAAS